MKTTSITLTQRQGKIDETEEAVLETRRLAKLCGAHGYQASRPCEVAETLSNSLAKRTPAVVHVKVDPDAIVSFRRDSFKHGGGAQMSTRES